MGSGAPVLGDEDPSLTVTTNVALTKEQKKVWPWARTSPKGQGFFFAQGTSLSAVSYRPTTVSWRPTAVSCSSFQLGPWWTPLYGTSFFFLALGDNLPWAEG